MKLIKTVIALACEDIDTHLPRTHKREVWLVEGMGLACTPYAAESIPGLASCSQWILTHVASGYAIGSAFPADKRYAHIWLEEIAREGLDFTQDRWSISAKKEKIGDQLGAALKRTEARWAQLEHDRKKLEREPAVQQLSLFEEAQ